MSQHKGSCLCGKVVFKISGDFESFFLCHCKYCQKDTGSAHAANLFSSNAKLQWISGEDLVKTFNLPGTKHSKSFCKTCGSAVPSHQMKGTLLVVPAGSLDEKLNMKPNAHIFYSSKSKWYVDLDNITKFGKLPNYL